MSRQKPLSSFFPVGMDRKGLLSNSDQERVQIINIEGWSFHFMASGLVKLLDPVEFIFFFCLIGQVSNHQYNRLQSVACSDLLWH